jgi:ubiquinone/menaquinone biosynthesis C-methylase UbiE
MGLGESIKITLTKVLWKLGLYKPAVRLSASGKKVAARLRTEGLLLRGIDTYLNDARTLTLQGRTPAGLPDAGFRNAWLRFKGAPDRLPIPSGELLFTVAATPNVAWFLHGGRLGAESINEVLRRNRVDYASWKSILDLGCGCGRVIRHLDFFNGAKLIGTDYNPTLIEWCDANLKFGQFDVNELEPPLKYADNSLDFVYALSVFTHLTESLQLLWMKELERVLRPGGYLLITTAGSFYQYRLNPAELAQFGNGEMVVWDTVREGSNYCAAFHPEEYVRTKLAAGFDVVDFVPEGGKGNPWQDLYLLKSKRRRLRDRSERHKLFGRSAHLVPPPEMMFDGPVGYEVFKENGEEFLGHYIELGGLKPDERMLDVGSGIGRKTLPLVTYLSRSGSYEGLDIVEKGVRWCTENYTSRFPNFHFHRIDVYNKMYNPHGTQKGMEYRLPFPDEEFDFLVMNSVFTHMLAEEVENYLSEVVRVLKVGGRCFISFFLLKPESLKLIAEGKSTIDLRYDFGPAKAVSREMPESAIGFDEAYVKDLFARRGLEIKNPIRYGSWCGRADYLSYQDLIVAVKTGDD